MGRGTLYFITGVTLGVVLGRLIGPEDRHKLQEELTKQAKKLRKEYEGPIKEGAEKVKKFMKEQIV